LDAEPEAMIHKRFPGALVALGVLTLAALTAGCGGSATKATPLVTPTTSAPTTATTPSAPTTAKTKPVGDGTTAGGASAPSGASGTAAQLSLAKQELEQAGVSLSGSDGAISGSDVNPAKLQEGSAP
jgi:hypothetical protein